MPNAAGRSWLLGPAVRSGATFVATVVSSSYSQGEIVLRPFASVDVVAVGGAQQPHRRARGCGLGGRSTVAGPEDWNAALR